MRGVAVLLACFLLAALIPAASSQKTLNVPSQYKTIQAAIDAANTKDTVLVAPGTYCENIDFKGKEITVKSSSGPHLTVIDGSQRGSVVTFNNNENRNSILDGFTITNGLAGMLGGGGIYCCKYSSPTITNNIITRNIAKSEFLTSGGGISCYESKALIINNVICYNMSSVYTTSTFANNSSYGGGIDAGTYGGLIINNIIFNNICYAYHGFSSIARGGGVCSWSDFLYNNTIFGNSVIAESPNHYNQSGGGLFLWSKQDCVVKNCIIWGNSVSQIDGYGTVSYSCIQGGFPGAGNISSDPLFVDSLNNDFHLRHDSPCLNKGTNQGINLPSTDFEGDPRVAFGAVDMGADEFFPHLYHAGNSTSGGSIKVNFIGNPGNQLYWAFSNHTLNPPASIPGLQGLFYLNPMSIAIIPMGQFPSAGHISLPYKFDPNFPKIIIPMQSLAGTQLTNLDTVVVR